MSLDPQVRVAVAWCVFTVATATLLGLMGALWVGAVPLVIWFLLHSSGWGFRDDGVEVVDMMREVQKALNR